MSAMPGAGDDDDARVMNGHPRNLYGSAGAGRRRRQRRVGKPRAPPIPPARSSPSPRPHLVAAAARARSLRRRKNPPRTPPGGGGNRSAAPQTRRRRIRTNQTSNAPPLRARRLLPCPPRRLATSPRSPPRAPRVREMEQNRTRVAAAGARTTRRISGNKRGGRSRVWRGRLHRRPLPGGKKYRKEAAATDPGTRSV